MLINNSLDLLSSNRDSHIRSLYSLCNSGIMPSGTFYKLLLNQYG